MTILIVEDDQHIMDTLEMYFQDTHRIYMEARTNKEALDVLGGITPKVVLLDLLLTDGLAIPVINHIKMLNSPSKIVLMSAHHMLDKIAEQYQIKNILKKPFSIEQLEEEIKISENIN